MKKQSTPKKSRVISDATPPRKKSLLIESPTKEQVYNHISNSLPFIFQGIKFTAVSLHKYQSGDVVPITINVGFNAQFYATFYIDRDFESDRVGLNLLDITLVS